MKKVLLVSPTNRDIREIAAVQQQDYEVIFHSFKNETFYQLWFGNNPLFSNTFDIQNLIQDILKEIKPLQYHGIISTSDYPGTLLSSILSHELGLVGPSPKSILMAQHKYYSRLNQEKTIPEATPKFALINPSVQFPNELSLPYPFFLKPVKSFFLPMLMQYIIQTS